MSHIILNDAVGIKCSLESNPVIQIPAKYLQNQIVSLWKAASKHESWDRTITILSALEVITEGELSDEIALLLWLAFMRQEMAAREVSQ